MAPVPLSFWFPPDKPSRRARWGCSVQWAPAGQQENKRLEVRAGKL